MTENEYTYAEAADLLPISESWLRKNLRRRRLPHHKWGGEEKGPVRFTDEDIAAIRAMFHVVPAPQPRGEMQGSNRSNKKPAKSA